jgi:hypothetical protein
MVVMIDINSDGTRVCLHLFMREASPQDHWQENEQGCQCCQNHPSPSQQLPIK